MRTRRIPRAAVAVAAAATLSFSLAACGGEDTGTAKDDSAASSAPAGQEEKEESGAAEAMPASDKPFGAACSAVPEDGAGSFDGMAQDPVATAASNNPVLSTLVTAVKKAGLVDTLNSAENITVFAPTNDAFAKIPKAELDKVLADKEQLTTILTHHVVGKRLTPQDLEDGKFDTLAEQTLTTSGSGEDYEVDGKAKVVCGNVMTANATVYIVDDVLMPAAS
ncbi:fasciclin domain-containing protein [Streptomyces thermolineatus]|uniref:Fasciclin domain-containing protein n=1 Tax=Streptomyces thermolineatus TaxID=44033 RepID=A0ABN3N4U5_9ACTN|nr:MULTISPECIES: fasciclin domain-containing protein [unclassified Streptomyces]MCZ2527151.1 fasciclin domain-containing protein [Streptomyces sp. HB2AG]PLW73780.1 fasciclin [Streptomyces sp. DJ]QMV24431.1 fasciclin domain-containing protein [Streptomyces sp. SCUT-3]